MSVKPISRPKSTVQFRQQKPRMKDAEAAALPVFAMYPSSRLKSSLFMQDIDFQQSCSLIHTSFRTQALQLCVGQLCLKSSHAKSPHALKVYEGLLSRWYVRSLYNYAHRTSPLNAGPSFEVLREWYLGSHARVFLTFNFDHTHCADSDNKCVCGRWGGGGGEEREREKERLIDWLIERLIDWLIKLYFSTVKMLAQGQIHISAVTTVLLIIREREREGKNFVFYA